MTRRAVMLVVASIVLAGVPAGTAAQAEEPVRSALAPHALAVPTAEPGPVSVDETPLVVVPRDRAATGRRAAGGLAADQPEGADRVRTDAIPVAAHQTAGVTWTDPSATADVEVRTRTGTVWSDWVELGDESTAPDDGTVEAARTLRGGTDSVWVGGADALQLSFPGSGAPSGVRLALVGSGAVAASTTAPTTAPTRAMALDDGGADAPATAGGGVTASGAVAAAAVAGPGVITRAQWGAAPQLCTLDVASTLVAAVVHHTAGPNTYANVAEAMAQIRNDQQYHQQARGWCDIGYNFLVDKWGNVYEGRANSGTQPVIGVHAGGFNTRTVGISMLGDYSSITPSAAVQESVARVIAWRLSAYYRDPGSTTTYTTLGGENSRYPAGTTLALPVVLGHRDVALTACPGQLGYGTLGWLRARARQMIGPTFVNPAPSVSSVARGGVVDVLAGTLGDLDWTLTVTDARTGVLVSRTTGFAQQALGGVVARWDGRGPGGVVGAGPYRMLLEATERASGNAVTPWATTVQVTGSQNPPTVAPVPLGSDLTFVPITPQRIADTRTSATSLGPASRMDVVVTGVAGVPAAAKAVALNLTAVHATSRTHLRAWPAGEPMPASSVLNTDPARTVAAHVVVGVGGEGKVSVYNDTGSLHVAVDVSGYYVSSGGIGFHTLVTPARLLDTRTSGPRLRSGQSRTVPVAGVGGVPADAQSVVVNVTSVAADAAGYLVAVPHGSTAISASTVNHRPAGDATNRATVTLAGGALDVLDVGGGADVVVDVVGWYAPGAGAAFTPIAPVRAFDTRTAGGALAAGEARDFAVGSAAHVPAGAVGVVLNVTATQQTAWATYLTAWSGSGARPATSDLNTGGGRDESNLAVVRPSSSGVVRVYNNLGSTHLVGDVFGYFR